MRTAGLRRIDGEGSSPSARSAGGCNQSNRDSEIRDHHVICDVLHHAVILRDDEVCEPQLAPQIDQVVEGLRLQNLTNTH